MKILTLITLLVSTNLLAANKAVAPHDIIKALLPSLIDSDAKGIKTAGCKVQKEKWALSLISKESFVVKIVFNKKCDLEGKFTVKMDSFFPVKLKIRNFKKFHTLSTNMKVSISFTQTDTLLKLDLNKSKLSGKKSLEFNLDYIVAIDPFSQPMLKKHVGGKLFIKKFGEQKFYKSYPLKFK
jgi:hypothetical protein